MPTGRAEFSPSPDFDDAWFDVDPRRIDIPHHDEIGAHELRHENARGYEKVAKARRGEPEAWPDVSFSRDIYASAAEISVPEATELTAKDEFAAIQMNIKSSQSQKKFGTSASWGSNDTASLSKPPQCFRTPRTLLFGPPKINFLSALSLSATTCSSPRNTDLSCFRFDGHPDWGCFMKPEVGYAER